MPESETITNWRHFARARVSCQVAYRDFKVVWKTRTKDISYGGLRLMAYQPFAIGKPLGLSLIHPAASQPLLLQGNVAQVCGGREDAIGVAFDFRSVRRDVVERWVQRVARADPTGEHVLTRMPKALPLTTILRREPFAPVLDGCSGRARPGPADAHDEGPRVTVRSAGSRLREATRRDGARGLWRLAGAT